MNPLHLLAWFLGGAFLANAVPHLVAGLQGKPLQTPFAHPPGEGLSSSRLNVLWAFANLVVAWLLLTKVGAFDLRQWSHALASGLGALALALILASRFGRFNGGASPGA